MSTLVTVPLAAFVLAHLADLAVTLPSWDREGNPLVLGLGRRRWATLKTGLLAGTAPAFVLARGHPLLPAVLLAGTVPPAAAVAWNLLVLVRDGGAGVQ